MTSNETPPPRASEPHSGSKPLLHRRIVLGVTGSIAAYKAVLLLRLLQDAGAEVEVLLTESGARFVGAATFRGLGATVHTDMFDAPGELHVELGRRADAVLIAPATADVLARLRQGRADDLLTATVLCSHGLVTVAPAMHPRMWLSPAVQENVEVLSGRGIECIGPASGRVASGDVGLGRLSEPEDILAELIARLGARRALAGRHIVVTAGPTSEPIDPVRSLTNISSGKMGFAIAAEAVRRGARVTLIAGPVSLPTPFGVSRLDVRSALDMKQALWSALGSDLGSADALVMSAAVADYRPRETSGKKLKRDGRTLSLELVPNPDILAEIGAARLRPRPVLVGFALETASDDELVARGRDKLSAKRVDLIVANQAAESLGRDDNRVFLVTSDEALSLPRASKRRVAAQLLDWLSARLTDADTDEVSE